MIIWETLSFTRKGAQIYGEARAWQFAVKKAPFSKVNGGYLNASQGRFYFDRKNTLVGRIMDAKSVGEVGKILFTPQTFEGTNEFGTLKKPFPSI